MNKVLSIIILFSLSLMAEFHAKVYNISPKLKEKMVEGNSWHRGCPVDIGDLRYIRLSYIDFQGEDRVGELIVNRAVADDMVNIMRELYEIG